MHFYRVIFLSRQSGHSISSDSGSSSSEHLTVVDTVQQLSPAHHRHSKGRQLVSILRRAEIAALLLGLCSIVTGCDYYAPGSVAQRSAAKVYDSILHLLVRFYSVSLCCGQTAYVDHLALLCGLVGALNDISTADLSLAQSMSTPEQQVGFVWFQRIEPTSI